MRRAAVIVHASRLHRPAGVRRLIERELSRRGWAPPLWLETTAADPGAGQGRAALAAGVDLVLVVGGDGTVRSVLGSLVGSSVPVGLVPSGTGNLLARNLRIPLTKRRAVRYAVDGAARPLDLLRWSADGGRSGVAAVMVGLGADAAVLADTNETVKKWTGQAAYVVAGRRHIRAIPVPTQVAVEDGQTGRAELRDVEVAEEGSGVERLVRDASLVEIGNVGSLMAGVTLLPSADPTDGRLDVLVASPLNGRDVGRMIAGVLLQRSRDRLLDRRSGTAVAVECERPVLCQVDGDVIGAVSRLRVEVLPGAVQVVAR
ncbi:MAG TPA: NAD(+)/NADH kinase [Tessaracoccus flavescens]|uniref:NAD(+)/NADH kinase n=1 Tax=Tessaracoccus flavescens TaxID=399497 RepID=A0A921ENL2_9ACTN|nr:NAD(+)/NADH kinase [Tessaracoccus flavescens]